MNFKKKQIVPVVKNLREFYEKRNKVLLIRNARGIGDILTCRMLFKAFKDLMPECDLTFACFKDYIDLVKDHPYLDHAVDSAFLNKEDYFISYDITYPCIFYESGKGINNEKHRADIWAEHCGLFLKDHDMFLPFLSGDSILNGNVALNHYRQTSLSKFNKNGPAVLFCPYSYETPRSLLDSQIEQTVNYLRSKGLFVYSTHNKPIKILQSLSVPVIIGKNFYDWMSYIHAADYVVTVDTGSFHYAGGIKKPLTGIFTHVDGKIRGQYYDFVLVQKHKHNGNWPCGPCYNFGQCTHPNNKKDSLQKPCLTELTIEEISAGIEKMLKKWPI